MNTFMHVLKSINWVDVLMLILLIRIVFIGIKTGLVTELFKLFGIFLGLFVAFHYYSILTAIIVKKTGWSGDWIAFVIFVSIVSLIVLAIKFLRDGFFMICKFEITHGGLNQWGAGVLAVVRAMFLASLIMYGILLSNVAYFQKQTFTSISQRLVLKLAPNTYAGIYNNLVVKLFEKEKFNADVFAVISSNSILGKHS